MDIPVKHLQMFVHHCSERYTRPVVPLVIYKNIQFLRKSPQPNATRPIDKRQLSFNIVVVLESKRLTSTCLANCSTSSLTSAAHACCVASGPVHARSRGI